MITTEFDDRPVVVAVADPEHVDAALRYAAAEAAMHCCQLQLVHADQLPQAGRHGGAEAAPGDGAARRTLEAALSRARYLLGDRLSITAQATGDPVVDGIVEVADRARMVVLQRRDPSSRHVVPRSVSTAVAAHTHVPVVVVPDGWTDGSASRAVVTVGVDVPARSSEVLREGLRAADARRATLRVVHTWWSPFPDRIPGERPRLDWRAEVAEEVQVILDAARPSFPDVDVEIDLEHGVAAEKLVAASHRSALVVLGRHDPLIPVGSHIGPVARAVLRDAACPVLLVTPRPNAVFGQRRTWTPTERATGVRRPAVLA